MAFKPDLTSAGARPVSKWKSVREKESARQSSLIAFPQPPDRRREEKQNTQRLHPSVRIATVQGISNPLLRYKGRNSRCGAAKYAEKVKMTQSFDEWYQCSCEKSHFSRRYLMNPTNRSQSIMEKKYTKDEQRD